MRDSSAPCYLGNQSTACNKLIMYLEELPKFEAAVWMTLTSVVKT